jgi:hypothetical protein
MKVIDPALPAALEHHIATLRADLEHRAAEIKMLKAQLAAADRRANEEAARTERVIDAFAQSKARAADEAARTAQAILVIERLALRLEQIAEASISRWRRRRSI